MINLKRRQYLKTLSGIIGVGVIQQVQALVPSPPQTSGPFYPVEIPLDDDNDLTRVKGKSQPASGIISDVTGKIVDINGRPVTSTRIEIWQCDANGRYRHPRENSNRPIDENFQGHGSHITDNQGRYRFRTIKPVRYPGRAPHIHVAVFAKGSEPFVTQFYVADENNESDFIYNAIPWQQRELVTSKWQSSPGSDARLHADYTIILASGSGSPEIR